MTFRPYYAVGSDGLVRVIQADPLYQGRVGVPVLTRYGVDRPDEDGTLPSMVRYYDRHAIRVGSADLVWYAEHGMRPDVAIVYLLDPSAREAEPQP